ncbi:MAG: glycosyltransferase [Clostridia bacterium]|jgi:glycosyltransferase involved in cell wall biosynthesis
MKKVFMIAYQYPPVGGPGVQRTLKFTKYLRDFFWEPVVLTRNNGGFLADETLLSEIPTGMEVIRTKAYDFESAKGILKYPSKILARKILMPDSAVVWYKASLKKAVQYIESNKPDVLYSTSFPYSDHLMALRIKKRFPNLPWVADFRDEWMNNPYLLDNPYNSIRMGIERRMERDVIAYADRVIANTPVMMRNFIRTYKEYEHKFSCIPNGFDKEDFADYQTLEKPEKNEKLTITYTGMLYGRRKPDLFLECLRELIDEHVISEGQITVKFIGKFLPGYFDRLNERYGLQNVIRVYDYMPHKECIKMLLQSDLLLLIEGAGPGGEAFYTGKLFEYMNAGRPIIAVIPGSGVAADLIKESRTGYVADSEDKNQILRMLTNVWQLWKNNKLEYKPDYEVINRFERRNLTCQLAALFNECTEVNHETDRR